ncbi:MAG: cytochrome c peroxidase [Phycisphaerales bacterium]|nr:cytochrome c peroxidase [Phycisphaerales bacterium]
MTQAQDAVKPASLTPTEKQRIARHGFLPQLPADSTNMYAEDEAAVALGHRLFFEKRLSGNGQLSCMSCHDPSQAFTDGLKVASGAGQVSRNTPTLLNVAHQRWFFWDGRMDTLWGQALEPIERSKEMDGDRVSVARLLITDQTLRQAYESAFGPLPLPKATASWPERAAPRFDDSQISAAWASMPAGQQAVVNEIFVNTGKSIAAYERKLVTGPSPFDLYVQGMTQDATALPQGMTPSAVRGAALFVGRANCRMCHVGALLSDGEFHSVGIVGNAGDVMQLPGRFDGVRQLQANPFRAAGIYSDDPTGKQAKLAGRLVGGPELWGQIRTPSLRNVAQTAPYMHNGQFASLEEVLAYYSTLDGAIFPGHHQEAILEPLGLTEQEQADLKAFLESLTGTPPEEIYLSPPVTGEPSGQSPSSSSNQ